MRATPFTFHTHNIEGHVPVSQLNIRLHENTTDSSNQDLMLGLGIRLELVAMYVKHGPLQGL